MQYPSLKTNQPHAAQFMRVKRDWYERTPAEWLEPLRKIEGVSILSEGVSSLPANQRTVEFTATPSAMAKISELFGLFCNIEPVNPHATQIRGSLPPVF